jgi:hypothetical protein
MRSAGFGSLIALAALVVPATMAAQEDFRFGPPVVQVTLRGGPVQQMSGGDLFTDLTGRLTLDRVDFRGAGLAGEVALPLTSRLSLVGEVAWSETSAGSEFRDWVGSDGEPILQHTLLRMVPYTLSVRYSIIPTGRRIGRHAWVPNRTVPYVNAGVGAVNYRLIQRGEFVDFEDYAVFPARLTDEGTGGTWLVGGGVDHWFTPGLGVNVDARYLRGSAATGGSFQTYDSIELGGFRAALGFTFRGGTLRP